MDKYVSRPQIFSVQKVYIWLSWRYLMENMTFITSFKVFCGSNQSDLALNMLVSTETRHQRAVLHQGLRHRGAAACTCCARTAVAWPYCWFMSLITLLFLTKNGTDICSKAGEARGGKTSNWARSRSMGQPSGEMYSRVDTQGHSFFISGKLQEWGAYKWTEHMGAKRVCTHLIIGLSGKRSNLDSRYIRYI